MADVRLEGEYQGVAFTLDNFYRFHVDDLDRTFPSYEEMKTAIDNAAKKIVVAKRTKLSIPALTKEGEKVVITGVHAGHGALITKPSEDRYTTIYANTKLVKAALAELRRLELDILHLQAFLETQQLNVGRWRRDWDLSQHESEIKRIEKLVSASEKIANLSLKEALSKVKRPSKLEL